MAAPQCRGCKAIVKWITTRGGKPMICDPDKLIEWVTDGARSGARKITLVADDGALLAGWQASVITPGSRQIEGRVPHWSTCPLAAQFKRAKESPDAD